MNNLELAFEPETIKRTPYKGEIGKLEEILDDLIGFHANKATTLKAVKQQYAERMDLLEYTKAEAPPKIIAQIEKIEGQLERLRYARGVQYGLEEGLKNVENGQKNNKNIERLVEIIRVSGTKQQVKYKSEFIEKIKDTQIVVNDSGYKIPLDEYVDQERHARKMPVYIPESIEGFVDNTQYEDLGILRPEILFETEMWYWRNKEGRNLSVRNARRIGRR